MTIVNPVLETEIKRIVNKHGPLTDKPLVLGGISVVGGTLSGGLEHIAAFHVEGWGLHRWANFSYVIAGADPLDMSIQRVTYRPELAPAQTTPWDDDDLAELARRLLYV